MIDCCPGLIVAAPRSVSVVGSPLGEAVGLAVAVAVADGVGEATVPMVFVAVALQVPAVVVPAGVPAALAHWFGPLLLVTVADEMSARTLCDPDSLLAAVVTMRALPSAPVVT